MTHHLRDSYLHNKIALIYHVFPPLNITELAFSTWNPKITFPLLGQVVCKPQSSGFLLKLSFLWQLLCTHIMKSGVFFSLLNLFLINLIHGWGKPVNLGEQRREKIFLPCYSI